MFRTIRDNHKTPRTYRPDEDAYKMLDQVDRELKEMDMASHMRLNNADKILSLNIVVFFWFLALMWLE